MKRMPSIFVLFTVLAALHTLLLDNQSREEEYTNKTTAIIFSTVETSLEGCSKYSVRQEERNTLPLFK